MDSHYKIEIQPLQLIFGIQEVILMLASKNYINKKTLFCFTYIINSLVAFLLSLFFSNSHDIPTDNKINYLRIDETINKIGG